MKSGEVLKLAQEATKVEWYGLAGPSLVGLIERLAELPANQEVTGVFVLLSTGVLMAGKSPVEREVTESTENEKREYNLLIRKSNVAVSVEIPGLLTGGKRKPRFSPNTDRPAGVRTSRFILPQREDSIEVEVSPRLKGIVKPSPKPCPFDLSSLPRVSRLSVEAEWNRRQKLVRVSHRRG